MTTDKYNELLFSIRVYYYFQEINFYLLIVALYYDERVLKYTYSYIQEMKYSYLICSHIFFFINEFNNIYVTE